MARTNVVAAVCDWNVYWMKLYLEFLLVFLMCFRAN